MHLLRLVVMILVLSLLTGCGSGPTDSESERKPVRPLTAAEVSVVESQHDFGIRLLQEIVKSEPDTNLFISPLSVSMALGMTFNGADGETRTAMAKTLAVDGMTDEEINDAYRGLIDLLTSLDPDVAMDIANSVWYRQELSIESRFRQLVMEHFDAQVTGLDFNSPQAPKIINGWVADKTREKITGIIDKIPPSSVMYLINATYFKGTWTTEFDPDATRDGLFFVTSQKKVDCRFMTQRGEYGYFRGPDFQAVDLPYGNGKFSMTVLLPDEGSSLGEIIESLTPEKWKDWLARLSPTELDLTMPRFTQEYEVSLKEVLSRMGMGIAFGDGADFSKFFGMGGLAITEAKHKTFVQVDEEGTEAAAVTSVGIGVVNLPPLPSVTLNRPFLFVIRDDHTNALIFVGRTVHPHEPE